MNGDNCKEHDLPVGQCSAGTGCVRDALRQVKAERDEVFPPFANGDRFWCDLSRETMYQGLEMLQQRADALEAERDQLRAQVGDYEKLVDMMRVEERMLRTRVQELEACEKEKEQNHAYLAAAALQGLLAGREPGGHWAPKDAARNAVAYADALLAELEKEKGQ